LSELVEEPKVAWSCEPPSLTPVFPVPELPMPELPMIAPSPSEPEIGGERVCIEVVVLGVVVVSDGLVVVGAAVFWTGAEVEVVGAIVVVGAIGASVVDGAPT